MKHTLKRILIDAAGYGLIVLGIALGWLPGPGGIPLVVAGLGLLSINNPWAQKLREYLLHHGGKIVKLAFPKHPQIQWLYDIIVLLLLGIVTMLAVRHAAIWEVSIAIFLFFFAVFIALMNRDRISKLRR